MINSRKGKKNRNKVDFGMPEYYDYYSKKYTEDHYKVTKTEYNKIISDYNKTIAEWITDAAIDFHIPFNLGILGVRKYIPEFKIEANGKIKNKLPINPIETAKLWEKNPEAKANKTFVRYTNKHSNGYVFSIYYFRSRARFKNKKAYVLVPKRSMKRRVAWNVKENNLDAFVLNP